MMEKYELVNVLSELADGGQDEEADHIEADKALLEYINDKKVTKYFQKIKKWYS